MAFHYKENVLFLLDTYLKRVFKEGFDLYSGGFNANFS
jgi:hypothetical protein